MIKDLSHEITPTQNIMKMKTTVLVAILTALTTSLCFAAPGQPETNGLIPYTGTHYCNTNFFHNGGGESGGVDITSTGTVIAGWEDDGGDQFDFEMVWTLFDLNLTNLTLPVTQTNRNISGTNGYFGTYTTIDNNYLSYFRSDGSPIQAVGGWGPKIKANRWGDGMGAGSSDWWAGLEIDELAALNAWNTFGFDSDMPLVQLLNNDGTPYQPGAVTTDGNGDVLNLGILGFRTNDVYLAGSVRIADWDYLSDGNIVIVGESRQNPGDETNVSWPYAPFPDITTPTNGDWALTGQTHGKTPVFRILTPGGTQVKGRTAVSGDASGDNDMWSGVGVTANGFACKWNKALRMFDNAGNPISTNIILETLTGHPEANASKDRGDNVGFHGNGRDAYAFVDKGTSNYNVATIIITNDPGPSETYTTNYTTNVTVRLPWITVLNTNGTVRWSRAVQDPSDPWNNSGIGATGDNEMDCAIVPDGRVIVVFCSPLTNTASNLRDVVQAKMFSPCGTDMGSRFFVSEWDNPTNTAFINNIREPVGNALGDITPRVAWRGTNVAFIWMTVNQPIDPYNPGTPVQAIRTFSLAPSTPPTGLAIAKSGNDAVVSWSGDGTLESANDIAGPWNPIYDCSPCTQAAGSAAKFYRVRGW